MIRIIISSILIFSFLISCRKVEHNSTGEIPDIKIVLPKTLEPRRATLESSVSKAMENIKTFAAQYGWSKLVEKPLVDSVMFFDIKKEFDKNLLALAKADSSIKLPPTYCAAIENKVLLTVIPEFYDSVYQEDNSEGKFERLLTHELAHSLHIRILNGEEDAMGPVWFYEGFAIFAASQFAKDDLILSETEIKNIMNDSERGNYRNYGFIFRYFVKKKTLHELINKAKNKNFNEWLFK